MAGNDDKRERIEHGGVHRRIARCLDLLRGGSGQSLVEVQAKVPFPRCGKDRVGQLLPFPVQKQRLRKPSWLIAMNK